MCANCNHDHDHDENEFPTMESHNPPAILFVILGSLGLIGLGALTLAIINYNKVQTLTEENITIIERVVELEKEIESLAE